MTSILSILLSGSFFGIEVFDKEGFFELAIKFSFNLLVALVIVRCLYYSVTKRKDYLFTYLLISSVVFLLCFLLSSVKLQLGFALGLFAIFGIIRYRTDQVPIKEMTYLFIIIALSVINALSNKKISYSELLFTNIVIIIITWVLEKVWLLKYESVKIIIYENINLINLGKEEQLIEDISKRTGLKINRIEIDRIDYMKDVAKIKIYYYEDENKFNIFNIMIGKRK